MFLSSFSTHPVISPLCWEMCSWAWIKCRLTITAQIWKKNQTNQDLFPKKRKIKQFLFFTVYSHLKIISPRSNKHKVDGAQSASAWCDVVLLRNRDVRAGVIGEFEMTVWGWWMAEQHKLIQRNTQKAAEVMQELQFTALVPCRYHPLL